MGKIWTVSVIIFGIIFFYIVGLSLACSYQTSPCTPVTFTGELIAYQSINGDFPRTILKFADGNTAEVHGVFNQMLLGRIYFLTGETCGHYTNWTNFKLAEK